MIFCLGDLDPEFSRSRLHSMPLLSSSGPVPRPRSIAKNPQPFPGHGCKWPQMVSSFHEVLLNVLPSRLPGIRMAAGSSSFANDVDEFIAAD
jgi:hypothetical protein